MKKIILPYSNVRADFDENPMLSSTCDFTTAQLTIINASESGTMVVVPIKIEDGSNSTAIGDVSVNANATVTVDFIMYKGKAVIYPTRGTVVEMTGNISRVDGELIATGDCSLTIDAGIN